MELLAYNDEGRAMVRLPFDFPSYITGARTCETSYCLSSADRMDQDGHVGPLEHSTQTRRT